MNYKSIIMKVFVLLSIFLAFFMMSGLQDDGRDREPFEKAVSAAVDTKGQVVIIKGNEVVTNLWQKPPEPPDWLRVVPFSVLNHKKGLEVSTKSDLFLFNAIELLEPAEINIKDKSYVRAVGSARGKKISVKRLSKFCVEGALESLGTLEIQENSAMYITGDVNVQDLKIDPNSYIYVSEKPESTVEIDRKLVNIDDYPNIISIPSIDQSHCPTTPAQVPTGGVKLGALKTEKSVDKSEVKPKDEIEYTISVKNTVANSLPLRKIKVEDTLDEGLTLVPGSIKLDGVGVENIGGAGNISVVIPTLDGEEESLITFKVTVNKGVSGEIVNRATVTNPLDKENPKDSSVTVNVVPEPDPDGVLEVSKEVSTPKVMVGQGFKYTITVRNSLEGSDSLKNITVEDTLPDGMEFVNGNINVDGTWVIKVIGNTFKINLEEVAYDSEKEITFRVRPTGEKIGTITNTALAKEAESGDAGISTSVDVEVVMGSIQITKVDALDNNVLLKGAEFELYKCEKSDTLIENCGDPVRTEISGDNGLLNFGDLTHGHYKLKETKAPDAPVEELGYRLLTQPIDVDLTKVNKRNVKMIVKNHKADWELPATGGIGTYLFYGLGGLLMISALYAVLRRKKKDD